MFSTRKHLFNIHNCDLEKKSKSCLPLLPPQSGMITRLLRQFKKIFQISIHHHLTKKYFRSNAMLMHEKRRHLRVAYWHTIHPFSIFSIGVEIMMTFTWIATIFMDSVVFAFYNSRIRTDFFYQKKVYLLDIVNLMYVLLMFNTGYLDINTHEIELGRMNISMHYVGGYFIIDLMSCVPLTSFIMSAMPLHRPVSLTMLCTLNKNTRLLRMSTMLTYSRHLTHFMRLGDTVHKCFRMFIMFFCFVHLSACLLFVIPRVDSLYTKKFTENSWVVKAQVQDASTGWKYLLAVHTAMCHFIGAGRGMYEITEPKEQVMCSIISITGHIFITLMTAVVLQMVSSTSASESKYEELVHTLSEYTIRKKMPQMLKLRLQLYYENKFQKRFVATC